jgi:type II secretory ATPase GspE/PulE/Tfp pilus assembly ATPase PilB-like protein
VVDDGTRQAIAQKAPVSEIRRMARAGGMQTLLVDGIAKALEGRTDMKQVLAVASK